MKYDEIKFLTDMFNLEYPKTARDLIQNQDYMHHKRAWYLLKKWCDKNLYTYGVSLDLGYLTDKGKELAKQFIK